MKRRVWSTAGLAVMVGMAIMATAPAAMADESTPVDELVQQAVDVSSVPVNEAGLAEVFSGMSETQAQDFINTQLVADTTASFVITPADATARSTAAAGRTPTVANAAAAAGCWTSKYTRKGTAPAGNVLYTYYVTGGWCSNGSSVTSARVVERGGETSTPGWRYQGPIAGASGVVSNQGRAYSQFSFVLGAAGIDIQSPTPCARVKGTASGGVSGDGTCSVT